MLKKITVDVRQASIATWVITFALPIALLFLPTSEVFTVPIRTYLAITLWMILAVAFDLFNPLIPGVLVSVLYYVCGVAPLEVAFGCWTRRWRIRWWAVLSWPPRWTSAASSSASPTARS